MVVEPGDFVFATGGKLLPDKLHDSTTQMLFFHPRFRRNGETFERKGPEKFDLLIERFNDVHHLLRM